MRREDQPDDLDQGYCTRRARARGTQSPLSNTHTIFIKYYDYGSAHTDSLKVKGKVRSWHWSRLPGYVAVLNWSLCLQGVNEVENWWSTSQSRTRCKYDCSFRKCCKRSPTLCSATWILGVSCISIGILEYVLKKNMDEVWNSSWCTSPFYSSTYQYDYENSHWLDTCRVTTCRMYYIMSFSIDKSCSILL